jgi:hypothetical protein
VNQPPPAPFRWGRDPNALGVYKDGPITGVLVEEADRAPKGTKLEGHLWTSGELIFGRYVWAVVPGQGRIPVCLELGGWGDFGIPKEEGSKPGAVIAPKRWVAFPTREWR